MKFDLHIHTNHSNDGVHDIDTMIKYAKKIGFHGVAITDHNQLLSQEKAKQLTRQYGILVIPGIEFGKHKFMNHLIALNIPNVPHHQNVHDLIDFIEDEGGLSIAPHPFSRIGFHNYHRYKFHAVESINGFNALSNYRFKPHPHITCVGGSDAHATCMVGYTWTEIEADDSLDHVLESIRHGRCIAKGSIVPINKIVKYLYQLGRRWVSDVSDQLQIKSIEHENLFYTQYRGLWTRV
jgi:predicted metal-dependent phosphoesterase TrpH